MIVFAIAIQMAIRSSHQRCSVNKMFVEILQISQENTCARVSFSIKLQVSGNRCFPMNFAKFLRTTFHRAPLNDCFSTIQHFLAGNLSKVLNGQQQHRGVIFHWSKIIRLLRSFFIMLDKRRLRHAVDI